MLARKFGLNRKLLELQELLYSCRCNQYTWKIRCTSNEIVSL